MDTHTHPPLSQRSPNLSGKLQGTSYEHTRVLLLLPEGTFLLRFT